MDAKMGLIDAQEVEARFQLLVERHSGSYRRLMANMHHLTDAELRTHCESTLRHSHEKAEEFWRHAVQETRYLSRDQFAILVEHLDPRPFVLGLSWRTFISTADESGRDTPFKLLVARLLIETRWMESDSLDPEVHYLMSVDRLEERAAELQQQSQLAKAVGFSGDEDFREALIVLEQ